MGKRAMSHTILVLNGPNLNMLGVRQPEFYGNESLSDIETTCRAKASKLGLEIDFRQSNHEGELVTLIQEARGKMAGIVINAAAYTHTSVGIGDAIKAISTPVIEVHISNTFAREDFRHTSFVTPNAKGLILGFGLDVYRLAIESFLPKS